MRSRLEHLSRRLVDLDAILSEPDAANDMNQYRKLSRERAELEPVVKAFEAFEAAETDLEGARAMLDDPEMKAMALEEIDDCVALNCDTCAMRYVIHHYWKIRGIGNRPKMRRHSTLWWLVVVRGHDHDAVCTGFFAGLVKLHGVRGFVGATAGDDLGASGSN